MKSASEMQNSGAWVIATHRVEDFAQWKPAFDGVAALKRDYGWKHSSVYMVDGDRNNVLVIEEFDSLDHVKAFARSPELKSAMKDAGVVGVPEVHVLSGIESWCSTAARGACPTTALSTRSTSATRTATS